MSEKEADSIIDTKDYASEKTDKIPEKRKRERSPEEEAEREDRIKRFDEQREKEHEAELLFKKSLAAAADAQSEFFKGLAKLIPLAEQFFKTKTPEVIEQFKLDLKRELDFSVAKVLWTAGLVDRELVDQMARQTYAPPPAQIQRSAADDALGSFDPSKLGTPRPLM